MDSKSFLSVLSKMFPLENKNSLEEYLKSFPEFLNENRLKQFKGDPKTFALEFTVAKLLKDVNLHFKYEPTSGKQDSKTPDFFISNFQKRAIIVNVKRIGRDTMGMAKLTDQLNKDAIISKRDNREVSRKIFYKGEYPKGESKHKTELDAVMDYHIYGSCLSMLSNGITEPCLGGIIKTLLKIKDDFAQRKNFVEKNNVNIDESILVLGIDIEEYSYIPLTIYILYLIEAYYGKNNLLSKIFTDFFEQNKEIKRDLTGFITYQAESGKLLLHYSTGSDVSRSILSNCFKIPR